MSEKSKLTVASYVDWVIAVLSLLVGIYLVATSWPAPGFWAWVFLAGGVIGIPVAYSNPSDRLRKWVFRRMIKR